MSFGKKTRLGLTNTNPLRRLKKAAAALKSGSTNPIVGKVYKEWTLIYRRFVHKRFLAASKGDGTWPPLKRPRTVRKTKAGKRDKRFAAQGTLILIETRTLVNAVDPLRQNAPGSFARRQGYSLTVGYGGNVIHPTAAKSGRMITIAQIAGFHQAGGGNLPQRRIIVGPDPPTIKLVKEALDRGTAQLLKG